MILVFDPDGEERDALTEALEAGGHLASEATSVEEALEKLKPIPWSVVLLNLESLGPKAVEFLEILRKRRAPEEVRVLLGTRLPLAQAVDTALRAGADDFFVRGALEETMWPRLRFFLEEQRLAAQSVDLSAILPEVSRFSPEAGDWVEDYKLLSLLGEGYWGRVYRSFDSALLREVAVKILKPNHATRDHVTKHLHEARVLAQVEHPGVIQVYGVSGAQAGYVPRGTPQLSEGRVTIPPRRRYSNKSSTPGFIVMELVHGRLLADCLEEHLPVAQAVDWAVDLLDALQAVHDRGIVHRDIKPANIMVHTDGRIRLMDFGLASTTVLYSGIDAIYGTPTYSSPEHFDRSLGPISVRSDLFAVGTLLYQMLTGYLPFTGQSYDELARAIVKSEPPQPESLRAEIGKPLSDACMKALRKNPLERYGSAREFALALRV